MKNLNQYIIEKLVLKRNLLHNGHFDISNVNFNQNAINYWKDELGFDPTKIDYNEVNTSVKTTIDLFGLNEKIPELFDYICAGSVGQGDVSIEEWLELLANISIEDYEEYNGELKYGVDSNEFKVFLGNR